MKTFRVILAGFFLAACILPTYAFQTQPSAPSSVSAGVPTASVSAQKRVTTYTLPPDLYKKAHDRSRIHFDLALIGFVYGLLVLWLILRLGLASKYRDWAEGFSASRFLQSVVFSPLLLLTIAILTLPLDVYGEMIEKRYGISVQSWGSWTWDWIKAELIFLVIGTILIWLLYLIIRRSPGRGWFYFWLISLPIGLFLVFLQPLVVDPLFHKFEPLQQKDPVLVGGLEQMVQHAGQSIPPERMFWMGAGEKTTAVDAYVTGVGGSKRIVVWDNTIAKMNTPQIVYVCGHEMGHYVLHHVVKGMIFLALLLFVFFYLLHRSIGWVLARWGTAWRIRSLEDWASLPALLLLLSVLSFASSPVACAFSRYLEHQADQYGLEVTHGLTPDFGQVGAQSFQILGEVDLADPDPNPVNVFLYYTHDPISERVRFCLTYDPWRNGGTGEFVK